MLRAAIFVVGILTHSGCGYIENLDLFGIRSDDRDCWEQLPSKLSDEISAAYQANIDARDMAIEAEQARLGVQPLMPTMSLGIYYYSQPYHKPEVDPFPDSVVAMGGSYDIRTDGYQMNHGKMGMTLIYETYPGSNQYFIVDRIGGDGVGGNGRNVIAETREYGLTFSETLVAGYSWHSWHSTSDNKIVRASQIPLDELKAEVRICGCGSGRSEVAYDAADIDPSYEVAIFILPGEELPEMLEEGAFSAEFKREYYKKIYVPSEGKLCEEDRVVC